MVNKIGGIIKFCKGKKERNISVDIFSQWNQIDRPKLRMNVAANHLHIPETKVTDYKWMNKCTFPNPLTAYGEGVSLRETCANFRCETALRLNQNATGLCHSALQVSDGCCSVSARSHVRPARALLKIRGLSRSWKAWPVSDVITSAHTWAYLSGYPSSDTCHRI